MSYCQQVSQTTIPLPTPNESLSLAAAMSATPPMGPVGINIFPAGSQWTSGVGAGPYIQVAQNQPFLPTFDGIQLPNRNCCTKSENVTKLMGLTQFDTKTICEFNVGSHDYTKCSVYVLPHPSLTAFLNQKN